MEGAPQPPSPNETEAALPPELRLMPWRDELVEAVGFGPRSMYVEMCWLPIMGPTTTWLYRRLGSWAEFNKEGVTVDTVDLSTSMGLGESLARNAGIARAIGRLVRFEAARWQADELHVRTALAPLPERSAKQLRGAARRLHEEMLRRPPNQITERNGAAR